DRADGRARVLRSGLLFDRDGRGQALDQVDVRLAHQFEELAGVGAQALDVAALALGVDGVERQRALARAGQAGEHHQLLARNVDIHALEVVLAGAAHANEVVLFCHGCPDNAGGRPLGPAQRLYVGTDPRDSARTNAEPAAIGPVGQRSSYIDMLTRAWL